MRVIAVANQKGGVGKTSTAVALAGLAVEHGMTVLLVDLDPHGSLTAYFGHDPDTIGSSVYTLFRARLDKTKLEPEGVLYTTATDGLALLPASTAMATLDRQLGTQEGMGLVVGDTLRQLAGRFDLAILDCPPMLGVLMVNALAACVRLIIPTQTEFLGLRGLERMLHTLDMIGRARRIEVPYTIVPTFFDRRTKASLDALAELQARYPGRLSQAIVPVDTRVREASKLGVPLNFLPEPSRALEAYRVLYAELFPGAVPPRARPAPEET